MSVLQISTWVLQERTALDIYLRSPGADCTRYLPKISRSGLHQISTSVLQERIAPDIYLSSPGTDCTRYLPEFSRNWLHQISTWVLQELTAPDIYLSSPGTDCQISTIVLQALTVPDIYLSFPGTDCTRYLPEFSRNWLHQISTRSKRNYCKPCSQYFQFLRRYQNILSWYLLKQFVIILFKVLLQSPDTELQVQFTTATFESLTD